MIVEYDKKYDKEIKELFLELQEYISSIDKEKYNIVTDEFKDEYFIKTMDEISKYQGKMLLMKEDEKIVGLIVSIINNEEINTYDFKAPKRGRITELVVTKKYRKRGIASKLLREMEKHLKEMGCKDILISVFGYNKSAIELYQNNGYNIRMIDMTKTNI